MEKIVICCLDQRSKYVKFCSRENLSDAQIVISLFRQKCSYDDRLNKLIKNAEIVLQKKDTEKDIWCDVDDSEILHSNILNVLLVPLSEMVKLPAPQSTSRNLRQILARDVIDSEPMVQEQGDAGCPYRDKVATENMVSIFSTTEYDEILTYIK